MKNNINKRIILIIMLLGIVIIILGIILMKKQKNENVYMGVSGTGKQENFYNWDNNLEKKSISIFNEVFDSNYDFKLSKNNTFEITLQELSDKYNKDLSMFKNENVECDLNASKIIVFKEKNEYIRSSELHCNKKIGMTE